MAAVAELLLPAAAAGAGAGAADGAAGRARGRCPVSGPGGAWDRV